MKRILLILFCFPFYSLSQGLQFEKGLNDSYNQKTLQILNRNDHTTLLIENYLTGFHLERYDSLGGRILEFPFQVPVDFGGNIFSTAIFVNKMVITNDGNIWVSGYSNFQCDIPIFHQHIAVFSSNGVLLQSYKKPGANFNSSNYNYFGLSAISDTSVAVNYRTEDDTSLVEIFSIHTYTALPNTHIANLDGFAKYGNGQLYGNTLDKIYAIDSLGNFLDSVSFTQNISEFQTWNDTIYVLGTSEAYKLNSDLQSYSTHVFPGYANLSNLKIDNTQLRFAASGVNTSILSVDFNFLVNSIIQIPDNSFGATHFDYDEFYTGVRNYNLSHFQSCRLKCHSLISPNNSTVNRSDIEISNIIITNPEVSYVPNSQIYYSTNVEISVLIKNNGPNVVDSVRLNYFDGPSGYCYDIQQGAYFSNLNLAVGDSVWVNLGWFFYDTRWYLDSVYRTYCIYSSNPNGIVDLNVSNDEACATQFFGFVGFEESNKLDFQLFPNPSSGTIQIRYANENDLKFSLQDEMGRMILSGELIGNTLELSDLSEGIYFISFQDNKGNISPSKKIVRI